MSKSARSQSSEQRRSTGRYKKVLAGASVAAVFLASSGTYAAAMSGGEIVQESQCFMDGSTVVWKDAGAGKYFIREVQADGSTKWITDAEQNDGRTSYTNNPNAIYQYTHSLAGYDGNNVGDKQFVVQHFHGGKTTLPCAPEVLPQHGDEEVSGDDGPRTYDEVFDGVWNDDNKVSFGVCIKEGNTLTWDALGATNFYVRNTVNNEATAPFANWAETEWIANSTDTTFELSVDDGDYVIQHFYGGKTTLPCEEQPVAVAPAPAPPAVDPPAAPAAPEPQQL